MANSTGCRRRSLGRDRYPFFRLEGIDLPSGAVAGFAPWALLPIPTDEGLNINRPIDPWVRSNAERLSQIGGMSVTSPCRSVPVTGPIVTRTIRKSASRPLSFGALIQPFQRLNNEITRNTGLPQPLEESPRSLLAAQHAIAAQDVGNESCRSRCVRRAGRKARTTREPWFLRPKSLAVQLGRRVCGKPIRMASRILV